jgi:uncharacterized repeat protein (TIGR01451 family)
MLVVLISLQVSSAYGGTGKGLVKRSFYPGIRSPVSNQFEDYTVTPSPKASRLPPFNKKKEAVLCGVNMQDSVVGYTKSSTNNQIFYLLTITNTGSLRDSFSFTKTTTGTPLYTYIETTNGTAITSTPGINAGASYSFIIRFVVPNGSPAETTNYTNLIATSANCGSLSSDSTYISTHLYSGKPSTGDSCDVQISKTANVGTVTAGNTITYTISLINNLPGLASDVFVIDTLASPLVYQSSAVTVVPGGLSYSLTYNSTSKTVQFKALSSLGQSQPITFTITVKALCTAVPSVINKASVTSSTYDNNSSNDASSVTTTVNSAYSAPTAPGVTSCYNSTALLTASGAASGTGYKWYSVSSGGSYLSTGSTYTTPVLNSSTNYYVSYYNIDTTACEGPRTTVVVTVKGAPVVSNPSGTTVCPNDAATFIESATGTSLTYQWQLSTNGGSSWTSLTNSSPYSGVTTSTLGISSTTYSMNGYLYRCNVTSGGCTNTISSSAATLTVRKSYTWLGVNTNWDDPQNWCSGVPDSSSDVTIPSGLTYYPVITGTASTHDIYTGSSTTVTLDSGTIRIFGTVTNNGVYDARTGTVNMKGSITQTIAGSMFNSKTILNLVDANTSSTGLSVSSTATDTLKISGTLSFGTDSSKLNTGNNIDLLSTSSGTANVGVVNTNNTITGEVIVDRYINTGTYGGEHAKSWQFLSTPTNGQSIRESWMEGGSNLTGFGTQITAPQGTANGFDLSSPAYSIKYYNSATNTWDGVSNANSILYNLKGYMLFVRGDRTVTNPFAPATNTILRSKGALLTGTIGPVTVSPGYYQSVGNPYASMIDFNRVTKDAGVDDKFYTWDPYLYGTYGYGGYQTMSSTNDWKPVPGGTIPYASGVADSTIQSGQAFFVYSTGTASLVSQTYSLSFTENCKVSGNTAVNFTRMADAIPAEKTAFLRASLFAGTGSGAHIADGNAAAFSVEYNNKVDRNDAIKIANGGENFGLLRDGKLLAIEARQPVTKADTLFYFINNVRLQTYQLRFAPENMQEFHLQPVLEDSYTNVYTPLSLTDTTFVNVSFTSDAASRAANRFKVVFREKPSVSLNFTWLQASLTQQGTLTTWKSLNEDGVNHYEIQYSKDGIHFETKGSMPVNKLKNGSYSWKVSQPKEGNNYYRICASEENGESFFSNVVNLFIPNSSPGISVFPNPVLNSSLQLHFSNQPRGIYYLTLLTSGGQTVYSGSFSFAGGSGIQTIYTGPLPKGIYQIELTKPSDSKYIIKVVY